MANEPINTTPSDIVDHLRRIKQAQRAVRRGADAVVRSGNAVAFSPENLDAASRIRIESLRSKLNAEARSDVIELAEDCNTVVGDFHRQVVADIQRAGKLVNALRNLTGEQPTVVTIDGEVRRIDNQP